MEMNEVLDALESSAISPRSDAQRYTAIYEVVNTTIRRIEEGQLNIPEEQKKYVIMALGVLADRAFKIATLSSMFANGVSELRDKSGDF